MAVKPVGMAPCAMVTLSVMEEMSPPPPLVAVVEAMACAVSSYCARVGVFDEVQAASERANVIKGMRFIVSTSAGGSSKARTRSGAIAGLPKRAAKHVDRRAHVCLHAAAGRGEIRRRWRISRTRTNGYGRGFDDQVRTSAPSVRALVRSSSQRPRSG